MSAPTSSKQKLVALAAGTHTWAPNPASEATQDEVVAILRKHGITSLDTARSYVCLPCHHECQTRWL